MNTTPKWSCESCTFLNNDNELACTMCFRTRSIARELPIQWEWQPNTEQWIPYDKAASTEIETAFQNPQQNKVTLTQGYFATHPGESEVLFDRAARSFVQVNTGSGRRRAVRRLANDDNSVLIRVPRATIGTDHNICAICQNRLDETSLLLDSGEASSGNSGDSSPNEKSPGSHQHQEGSLHESVRLPQCAPGHYFHRVCVAQAIKLKDQCPMCGKKIVY